ncbi:SusC/RagA family TonB-linked outer membrane protein [Hoylesella timonensis 4401737 = DSM 22865 = JCM 15640]|uniref:SusC/RagA family TonB-linked outer membrane protein n=1 Tax=Hoylesella timonensis TaxID=386414 RepID=UPI000412E0BA|nr:SusC/RagA family TonB-linked outer membrane protein [Hoylesella timonensis]
MNRILPSKTIRKTLFTMLLSGNILLALSTVASPSTREKINNSTQQDVTCTGIVSDIHGEPITGASVVSNDKKWKTITDIDGRFSLKSIPINTVFTVSYLGFETITVKWQGKPIIITLKETNEALSEVVVTALGIKRAAKALSYNVQELAGEKLNTVKDANFMNSLSGKVAGVNINASSAGIGGATRVVMRGIKSIAHDNNALYVIDGVPISNHNDGGSGGMYAAQPTGEGISDLNADDIESMSVLSGPAAAALYGSSAANGVILITTKKGAEGITRLEVSNSTTFSNPFIMPEFQDTYSNRPGEFKSWGKKGTLYSMNPADFFNTGTNLINSVTFTTGTKKNQTFASASLNNAAGILPNNTYNRYNFTIRNTTKFLNDKLTLDVGANYVRQNQKNMMAQGEYWNPLLALYLFPRGEDFDELRQYEIYDPVRRISIQNWTWGDQGHLLENPYWQMHRKDRTQQHDRYMLNANLTYDVMKWLSISGRIRMDNQHNNNETKYHATTNQWWTQGSQKGLYGYGRGDNRQIYGDLMANVNKNWNETYSLSCTLGTSFKDYRTNYEGYSGPLRDMPNVFNAYNIDTQLGTPGISHAQLREYAIFASAELGWRSMVYLTMTARNEWSSTLSNTSQMSYFFPSIGISGIISQMVKLPKAINYLKARISWADVGSPLPMNLTEQAYTWNSNSKTWDAPNYRPINKLYPEKTTSWEAGINTKLFDNTLSLDATWYLSDTKKQTFNVQTSAASGYSSMYIQTGNVRNWGMEFALGYHQHFGLLNWESNLTYSFNRNKITELVKDYYDEVTNEHYHLDYLNQSNVRLVVGGTMGDIYAGSDFKRDPEGNIWVDPSTGNVVKENLEQPVKIGSVLPDGNLGWRNSITIKGVNLTALLTARFGGHVLSVTQSILDEYGVSKTSAIARDNGGIQVNRGLIDPEKYYTAVAGREPIAQEYLYSATNVRLQELSVGYTIPKTWLLNTCSANISLIARNLWMIYCKAPFDPESTASTGTYMQGYDYFMQPSMRSIGFSVKLKF